MIEAGDRVLPDGKNQAGTVLVASVQHPAYGEVVIVQFDDGKVLMLKPDKVKKECPTPKKP